MIGLGLATTEAHRIPEKTGQTIQVGRHGGDRSDMRLVMSVVVEGDGDAFHGLHSTGAVGFAASAVYS
jgi:hypothetical protein